MLFIIFGWKTRTKEYGPAYPAKCPHCNNDGYFHLLKARRWFRLYFIPVIPLSRASYDLVCPTCNASISIEGGAAATQAKTLVDQTEKFLNESRAADEYERDLAAFESDVFGRQGPPEKVDATTYQPTGGGAGPGLFRGLMALMFVFAILGTIVGISNLNPNTVITALFALPYLFIRYRDPDCTTIPLAGLVKRHT